MNSNFTVARSPVRRMPCGWSMSMMRTVWRTAWEIRSDSSYNTYRNFGYIRHNVAWPIEARLDGRIDNHQHAYLIVLLESGIMTSNRVSPHGKPHTRRLTIRSIPVPRIDDML